MPQSQRRLLEQNVEYRPNEVAVRAFDSDETLTYREFDVRVNRAANGLHDWGLRAGDRVAMVLRNSLEFVDLVYACHKLGMVAVPLNYRLATDELEVVLNDTNAAAVVYDVTFAETVEDAADRLRHSPLLFGVGNVPSADASYEVVHETGGENPPPDVVRSLDDPSYLIYTSGTTGKPKGVTHTTRTARERIVASITAFDAHPDAVFLSQLPFFHGAGLDAGIRTALTVGGELVIAANYADPETALDTIEAYGVTHIIGIRTVTRRFLEQDDVDQRDLSSVECWYHTGEVLPEEEAKTFQQRLTHSVYNSYGSSEGGFITVLRPDHLTDRAGSVGRPTLGTDVRVVGLGDDVCTADLVPRGEEGEVLVRSDQLFHGYYGNRDKTDAALRNGWYHTNDLGYLDKDGFLTITGRVDDVVVSGGELVSPVEVEEVLENHPSVDVAVVVGVPDEQWGERVKAVVVADEVTSNELDTFCRSGDALAKYKRPREYEFVDEIEYTETGKKERSWFRTDD